MRDDRRDGTDFLLDDDEHLSRELPAWARQLAFADEWVDEAFDSLPDSTRAICYAVLQSAAAICRAIDGEGV